MYAKGPGIEFEEIMQGDCWKGKSRSYERIMVVYTPGMVSGATDIWEWTSMGSNEVCSQGGAGDS